jgi:sugar lactone lactonase YvrE
MSKNKLIATIFAVAILATTLVANASLAVYGYKGSSTTIGGNQSTTIAHTGKMALDLETMLGTYVGEFATGSGKTKKTYFISRPLSSGTSTQVLGPKGSSYTILCTAETPGSQFNGSVLHFERAKGLNSLLTIKTSGTKETKWLPKTLVAPGYIITEDSAEDYDTEISGALTFDSTMTTRYNNAGKSLSEAVSEMENGYKTKYTQWDATSLPGMPIKADIVSTLAGGGPVGEMFKWADGQGTAARFCMPTDVAVDTNGNVYVADSENNRIRKISASGNVTTLAGSGISGSADGRGTAASFANPLGLAVDGSGNVYVADSVCLIRKISASGNVTTLAGSPETGYADGKGTAAKFGYIGELAVDKGGNVYAADFENQRIRKISASGNVTTLAGSGEQGYADGQGTAASFDTPWGLAVDGSGNVYVADVGNQRIRKISASGNVTTLAGSGEQGYADGQGAVAAFSRPLGLAVDGSGNVYVTEGNERIRKISASGNVTTLAGSGTTGYADGKGAVAAFSNPCGLAVDGSGNVYVADSGNNRIRKISK